ncbi:hypothetical protein, conserved [Trypanosoma brucei gambiense DAL972]|uniref:Uncharacterized protein n=2 Tax=Trypanosoma brucei TaxID=5691 RepID=C9ZKA0_TRYB9|nr:hypothetical protein, conserved [Trypanosoma brucei gambiense DAL972]RHW73454.1 hypothetical protein DPX39_030019800 [Trypanosoma brucei equiperdum]CBH09864.1 hypothetical protein, conserved [Trypanosoma brucei gambiense DAL972]|eukprot:XP_011772157.1 hypothetical protein, conserved [Trypanosoma brucei gambiense DAL972]
MSLFAKKKWRVQDIIRTEEKKYLASVLKVTHPFRKQQIVIVPAPRYALDSYYSEWVYQPYAKEHKLYVSNDIFNPTHVYLARILLRRNIFPGYAYFHPMGFPDCIDLNLTRREFISREQPIRTPMLLLLLTPNMYRERFHSWVGRRVLNIVGERYVTHPSEDNRSLMFILPPAYVPDAVNVLQSLGFNVTDHTTAVVGDTDTVDKLNKWGDMAQVVALAYIWFMFVLLVVNESHRMEKMFEEYKRELAEKAGRDPTELGL